VFYIKKSDGSSDYEGWCWPGSSSWVDFTSPEVRSWWADQFSYQSYVGSTNTLFTWNDMNEPSVFNGPEVSMHKDARHSGNIEHREIHNAYGFYMQMATIEGLVKRNEGQNERPFLLSRAFFAGSQKYGAIWTGDNTADWNHLQFAQPMLLSISLAGVTFCGADVGGFFGNTEPELMTRWYQAGAFYPFFRGHAHLDTKRKEPYLFGEPYTTYFRDAIRTRYALLPYWYTTFYLSEHSGLPILRALWLEFPAETKTYGIDDEFMIGEAILVKPITTKGQTTTSVYFPGSSNHGWYDIFNFKRYDSGTFTVDAPLDKLPAYQRAGTILPKKERARRSSSQMFRDPYTLVVALDHQRVAKGELYVDDGHSFDYRKDDYFFTQFSFKDNALVSTPTHLPTKFTVPNVVERLIVLGLGKIPTEVTVQTQGAQGVVAEFNYDEGLDKLVVRKPDLPVVQPWTVTFEVPDDMASMTCHA